MPSTEALFIDNVSCRRDMTEILLKAAQNTIQSIEAGPDFHQLNNLRPEFIEFAFVYRRHRLPIWATPP